MAQNVRMIGHSSPDDPYVGAVAITGSAQVLNPHCRAIMAGSNGNVAVIMVDGSAVTLIGLVAGQVYRFACREIVASGTTITNSFALT
jgi:hypothetical protein